MTSEPSDTLQHALQRFEMQVPEYAFPKLERYCQSVWELNQTMNLTRHTNFEKFVTRDLLDSLQLSRLIKQNAEVLDVGSGGGVPGLLLAILRPDLKVTLTDSVGKKARAMGEIADKVDAPVEIYQIRAEELLEDFRYDVTTARAVGPLKKIAIWFERVWPSVGELLAIKGPNWKEEKAEADLDGRFRRCDFSVAAEYNVPGEDWSSVILSIRAKRSK